MKGVTCLKRLIEMKPQIQQEYHTEKNSIPFEELGAYEKKKYWWRCSVCEGEYLMSPFSKVRFDAGCLYCAGKLVLPGYSCVEIHPILLAEWHKEKNKDLDPYQFSEFSSRKVFWVCQKNYEHEWNASIRSRSQGRGCPYCAGKYVAPENSIAVTHPHVVRALHKKKNANLDIERISEKYQGKAVVFVCSKGHHFKQRIPNYIQNGEKCDTCREQTIQQEQMMKMNRKTIDIYEAWISGKRVPAGFWKDNKEEKLIEIIRYVTLIKNRYRSKEAFIDHVEDVSQYIQDMKISSIVRKTFGSEGKSVIAAFPEWSIQKREIRKQKQTKKPMYGKI